MITNFYVLFLISLFLKKGISLGSLVVMGSRELTLRIHGQSAQIKENAIEIVGKLKDIWRFSCD